MLNALFRYVAEALAKGTPSKRGRNQKYMTTRRPSSDGKQTGQTAPRSRTRPGGEPSGRPQAADSQFDLGDAIRELREARGMLQGELAKQIRTTQGYVSKLETNRTKGYSVALLRRLAESLGVRLYELLALAEGVRLEDKRSMTKAERDLLGAFKELSPDQQHMLSAVANTLRPLKRTRG